MIMLCYIVFDWSHTKETASKRKKSELILRYEWYTIVKNNSDFQMKKIFAKIIKSGMQAEQL